MRKILLAGVAALALVAAGPAFAQDATDDAQAGAAVGATTGGITGGTIGFFLGGPLGAIIGGFTGAAIGAQAGIEAATVEYSANNPVDQVYLDADLEVGFVIPDDVEIHAVPDDDRYGYVYANNRVYIVDLDSREIVHSPGFLVEAEAVQYVQSNPTADVEFDGDLAEGVEVNFELNDIPDNQFYGYAYVDGQPVLVERDSRRIVWVG